MIFYITALRALAAILITNSHYTGVYPTDIIANGGLLGDVIFFAVSGFCLCNIQMSFGKWYAKRITRIYPATIVITLVYMLLGLYKTPSGIVSALQNFIYPTQYHFVASIILLYIPFYIIIKKISGGGYIKLHFIMLILCIIHLAVYLIFYDKTYYHIDNVHEPMIRFLYFEAMFIGVHFKNHRFEYENKIGNWMICFGLLALYFISKTLFVKVEMISELQIVNQAVLLITLYYLMKCFSGLDGILDKIPDWTKRIVQYIADITLEIYVVQLAIIPRFAKMFVFPLNWIVITTLILVAATLLHMCARIIQKGTDKLFMSKV